MLIAFDGVFLVAANIPCRSLKMGGAYSIY